MNDEHDLTRRTTLYGIASTGFLPLAGLQGGTLESQQDETGTDNSGSSLPPLAWEWTDDTSDGDQVVQDLVETQDGAIVCAGIEGDESGVQNVLLRKIDNTGEAIWSRTLGGDRNDAALGVQEAADGTLVLCGGSMSESSNLMDTTVWLTDADGTLERSISFGRPGTNDAAHAITSGSNGYVLGGGTHYLGGAFGDGVGRLVKIDDDGAEEWSTTVGGGHVGEIYDVTTTSGGQYAFVGTRAGDDGEGRAWLGVVDRTGDLEWSRTYGASGSRIGYSLVETDDGGFAFAGTTQPPGQDEPRAWVVKVDLRGDLEWERTYGGTGHNALVSIDEAIDEGYVLAGWTEDEDDGDMGWLLHIGDDGELEGEETYGNDADSRFNTVIQTGHGYTGGGLTMPPGESSSTWVLGAGEESDQSETESGPDLVEGDERATVTARVTIENREYLVLQEIPGEPPDRFAYTDDQYRLLAPDAATNVAISYSYCDNYTFTNERRLEYTIEQYEEFGSLERMARTANLLSDLSGVIALAKISPTSAASNAVSTLQTAVEWGAHELNNPYHEQYAKMAATSSTVDWADERLSHPGGALLDSTADALEVAQTMIGAAGAIDASEDLAQSASTVREIIRQADSIRDNVSPAAVDGVDQLAPTAYTLLFGLAVDATVDSVSGVAEGQARTAAIGKGQAAARLPLLNELIELEERAGNYDLGPAGVIRMQTLHQTDYQIESAALYGQASIIENYQSSRLGSVIADLQGTNELPATIRSTAETYRDLSQFQFAAIGELFEQALENYSNSVNAEEYGDQNLLNHP